MPPIYRILDANANRAREALRVMEEAARFILDNADLTAALKSLRHDLAGALQSLPSCDALIAWRDTPGDVGTAITTAAESRRESPAAVVLAAGKRLSEALRVLEEYGKTVDPPFAQRIETLRYRAYDLEKQLNCAMAPTAPPTTSRQWRVCVLISECLCPNADWLRIAQACIDGGADAIQLREKSLDAGELLNRAKALVALCRPAGVTVIINDRPDIALLAGADGVHLGQTDLPVSEARKLVGRQLIIGVSTSNLAQAKAALADGADYCGVGPMFPTATKHKDHIAGPAYLREYAAWGKLPHLAIGGITPDNLPALLDAGTQGIAVSACVCNSQNPAQTVSQLTKTMLNP